MYLQIYSHTVIRYIRVGPPHSLSLNMPCLTGWWLFVHVPSHPALQNWWHSPAHIEIHVNGTVHMVGEFSHTAARGQTLRMEPKHLLEGPTALHCDYQPQQQNKIRRIQMVKRIQWRFGSYCGCIHMGSNDWHQGYVRGYTWFASTCKGRIWSFMHVTQLRISFQR